MSTSQVIVVGAGVIGLTTSLVLLRSGFSVRILTRELTPNTTSAVAAAYWYPYHAEPVERVAKWGALTLEVYKREIHLKECGIRMRNFLEVSLTDYEEPWWSKLVGNFVTAPQEELPLGFATGFSFDAPVIDTTLYLPYLVSCVEKLGVAIELSEVQSLSSLGEEADAIVNCTGVDAGRLTADQDLHPARGQVISIKSEPHHRAMLHVPAGNRFAQITPRENDTILGGIYEEHVNSLIPDEAENFAIIERCREVFPELDVGHASILGSKSGLRPARSSVRLETEDLFPSSLVVHNYGHGGAGFTLAWGCAQEVADLINSRL